MSLDLRERSSRQPASTSSTMKPKSRAKAKFRGSTHWFNGITPDFYDSHLAFIAVRTAHPHNAVYPKATVPEVVSDLLDEIRAGWCVDNSQIYATGLPSAAASSTPSPAPPVGRNFAAFAAGSGSFLLHRPRRRLGQLTSQPYTPARSPLPVLKIHGGSDVDVPYAGGAGEGGTEPAIPDW
ncbi:hypothetical protein B0H14DRAFT_3676720 [Mycena olivaceomarginata]|nr:hypothetical protein B0H14DRAFT_3676720 [Mycena olivaceomarginata]